MQTAELKYQTTMTHQRRAELDERRNAERVACLPKPKGRFRLYVDQQCYDVRAVRDISPFGAKIEIEAFLDIDETVRLTFESENTSISVSGLVMWSVAADLEAEKDRTSRGKKAGIYFQPQDAVVNLHFFNTLTTGE